MQHAKDYSASSSARWLGCPGSVKAVRNYVNRGSGAALEGTCAHQLGQIGLESNLSDKELLTYIGKSLSDAPDVVIDREMVDNVQGYIDYCRSFSGDQFVEVKVSYENVVVDGFGTSDFIAIDAVNKKIACVDLKYGRIEVSSIDNTQAQLYALGTINEYDFVYDFDESWMIEMHIYQPRIHNFSDWEIMYSDLMVFADYVRKQVELSKQPDAPFNPSNKACQWCLHKAKCKALQEFTEKVICSEFDDLTLPAPETVNIEQVLQNKGLIEAWLKAVEQHAFEQLSNGVAVDGFKLVEGRSVRKWGNELNAVDVLRERYLDDELYTKKFLTVTQAEKLIGKAEFKENFNELVIKPEGKPTLAPESDKRKPVGCVVDCFDKIS